MTTAFESRQTKHAIEQNGVTIVRMPNAIGVAIDWRVGAAEIDVRYGGKLLKSESIHSGGGLFTESIQWRDSFGPSVDHLRLHIVVKQGEVTLAELLPAGEEHILPFMRRQGDQNHITENDVAVPPALTITDSVGAVWTIGMTAAPAELSPRGEFAFDVLRDGITTHEIASRIERRNGKIRIFTRHGWKVWNGQSFF